MYGKTAEAAEMRQETTLKAVRALVGPCRQWKDDKCDICAQPADYVLWGKLFNADQLGPRCYDCAFKHVHYSALSRGSAWALINLDELADVIDKAHVKAAGW